MAPITKSRLFIYELSPHTLKCELHENRDPKGTNSPLLMVQSPHWEQCLERRKCSLNALTARMRNLLKSFVKTSPLCVCIFFYNESNKHFSILLAHLSTQSTVILPKFIEHLLCARYCAKSEGFSVTNSTDHTPSFLVLAFNNDSDLTLLKSACLSKVYSCQAQSEPCYIHCLFKCYNSMKLVLFVSQNFFP